MKKCITCKKEKSRKEFYASPATSDGLQSECKCCQLDRQRERRRLIRNGTCTPRARRSLVPRKTMYRRGTLDMPKCSHTGCRNYLYWDCEKRWNVCIHHHNLAKRKAFGSTKFRQTIPQVSIA